MVYCCIAGESNPKAHRAETGIYHLSQCPGVHSRQEGAAAAWQQLLRGAIVNRIYGTHKNFYICLLLSTIFGPVYYGPPEIEPLGLEEYYNNI